MQHQNKHYLMKTTQLKKKLASLSFYFFLAFFMRLNFCLKTAKCGHLLQYHMYFTVVCEKRRKRIEKIYFL